MSLLAKIFGEKKPQVAVRILAKRPWGSSGVLDGYVARKCFDGFELVSRSGAKCYGVMNPHGRGTFPLGSFHDWVEWEFVNPEEMEK